MAAGEDNENNKGTESKTMDSSVEKKDEELPPLTLESILFVKYLNVYVVVVHFAKLYNAEFRFRMNRVDKE